MDNLVLNTQSDEDYYFPSLRTDLFVTFIIDLLKDFL